MLSVCFTHYKIHFVTSGIGWKLLLWNDFGVSLFFVISGFVIPYAMFQSGYTWRQIGRFFKKRFIRVYPTFLCGFILSVLLMYIAFWFSPFHAGGAPHLTAKYIIGNLLLIPHFLHEQWYSPVLWTLAIEVQFYLFIALAFPLIFHANKMIGLLAVIGFSLLQFLCKNELIFFFHVMVFMLGVASSLYFLKRLNTIEWGCISILLLIGIYFKMEMTFSKFIALPVGCIIILFVPLKSKFLAFCGKISYSYYLLHILVGGSVMIELGKELLVYFKISDPIYQNMLTLSTIFLLIPISWVWYKLFEEPFQKLKI